MGPRILYIEPFMAGSHRVFTQSLLRRVAANWTVLSMPGRHWKWRARGSAVYFAQAAGDVLSADYDLIWASSFLNLADFMALCPQFQPVPRILYFHENQLAYPVRPEFVREGDNHFGFSQLVSCLVATRCVFNSAWNRDSFLTEAEVLLRQMPDRKPPNWLSEIRARSEVMPVLFDAPEVRPRGAHSAEGPLILWNHRWEHDKAPEVFFKSLYRLQDRGVKFRLAVCGERYRRVPPIFEEARTALGSRIIHWGYVESKDDYYRLLNRADLVVSTARHEFFGISMLEAVHCGARPLAPDALSYRELFAEEFRYGSEEALLNELIRLCHLYDGGTPLHGDFSRFTGHLGASLDARYRALIDRVIQTHPSDSAQAD